MNKSFVPKRHPLNSESDLLLDVNNGVGGVEDVYDDVVKEGRTVNYSFQYHEINFIINF